MAKRIVNKAERNAERYDAKETGYQLYEDSQNGKAFERLMLLLYQSKISYLHIGISAKMGEAKPLYIWGEQG